MSHSLGQDKISAVTNRIAQNIYVNFNNAQTIIAALLAGFIVYGVLLAVYRLYLHPLARFPGPKKCAVTEWYEFYCSVVKEGQWGNEVRKMHEEYGIFLPFLDRLYGVNGH